MPVAHTLFVIPAWNSPLFNQTPVSLLLPVESDDPVHPVSSLLKVKSLIGSPAIVSSRSTENKALTEAIPFYDHTMTAFIRVA